MNKLEKDSYKSMFEDYKYMYNEYEIMKRENEFLRQRENKLQMIEQLFLNEPVNLSELAKLVKGDDTNERKN